MAADRDVRSAARLIYRPWSSNAALMAPLLVWVQASRSTTLGLTVILTLGALHLLYDGFIWRAPRPVPGVVPALDGQAVS